jgi:predicted metal-binding membrane protein
MDTHMAMEPMGIGGAAAMWATMMAFMMLPGALPAILRYPGAVVRSAFGLAYLFVWTGFSAGAAVVQGWLGRSELLSENMTLRSSIAAGIVIIAVGVYQVTPWKHHFLLECRLRPPHDDRLGGAEGIRAGLRYGVSCLGSSAALMALMFVAGATSYPWMVAIAAWVLAEKSLPWGTSLPRVAAVGLLGWGGVLLALSSVWSGPG